jgi:hypothetical protein
VVRSTGIISTLSGTTGGVLNGPQGIWGDSIGNLFIADHYHCRIKMLSLSTQTLSTIAVTGAESDTGDGGSPTLATFKKTGGIWGDSDGLFLFITDHAANKIRVIDKSLNIIYTAAGTGTASSGVDGLPATSTNINYPYGIWGNTAGIIFIAERYGQMARKLWMLPSAFPIPSFIPSAVPPFYLVATVAGTGSASSSGDGGQATSASINNPSGIWQNSLGTLFIAEFYGHRVRAMSSSGIISTVAGTGGYPTSETALNGDNGPVRLLLYYHIIIP